MTQLTAGLLDVSRISRGELRLQRERVDLRLVLGQAIETMEPDMQQRGHRLSTLWPDRPVWVHADTDRLNQVFGNLLGNASKYTDPAGNVALSLQVREHDAVVCVRDSGIGIAAEDLPQIFDLFMQADQAAARSRSGLGIGLALVRTLVELHGGRVAVFSAGLGQGSEFTVWLPLEGG
jgi:signal transduction histidine kinase